MQVVFYMTPDEEARFIAHVLAKGGYYVPQYWPTYPMPLLAEQFPSAQGKTDPMRELMIFKEALFSKAAAVSEDWRQFWSPGGKYISRTWPGFEFTRPCVDEGQLFPGRLWVGASASSFIPPSGKSGKFKTSESHREADKKLESFYKACCSYLRKELNKYMTGWYIGPEVENFCTARGLSRAPTP
ncbi:MAG TPA: hypothetical protein VFQ31_06065 [Methyloceanibacter sp.]|nr:hypothetical protein [Methyloceanibacter sp.]